MTKNLLSAATIGSAFAQAPASVAGYTYREQYLSPPPIDGVHQVNSIDLISDGTFAYRFSLSTPDLGAASYNDPTRGVYTYTRSSTSQATLTLHYDGNTEDVIGLTFLNNIGGTTDRIEAGTFSISVTGGVPEARALVNMSTLISAKQGSPAAFGFVLGGTPPWREILIRAVGPSLAQFGISNFAASPGYGLSGMQSPGTTQSWSATAASSSTISAENTRAGAFPLLPGSNDKADIYLLAPGAYTITVNPTDPTETGTELIEVYEVE